MELKQTQKLSQVLSLTPLMKQSLQILQLPLIELKSYVDNQMEENPVLEFAAAAEQSQPVEETIEQLMEMPDHYSETLPAATDEEDNKRKHYQDSLTIKHPTLQDHLLKQLRTYSFKNPDSYAIGEFIIGNIDDNGYLNMSIEEIARLLNKSQQLIEPVTYETVEKILSAIQTFNPPGVGARNIKECLLIQLKQKDQDHTLAYTLVKNHLTSLANGSDAILAKKIKTTPEAIVQAKKLITSLLPKPGSSFHAMTIELSSATPDIFLQKNMNKFEIIINTRGLPPLKISNYYKNLLKAHDTPVHIRKYLQEKIMNAMGIIKALAQREETIRKIVTEIVHHQKDFFELNDPALLKPLMLRDISVKVNRSESTISRVVNSKYMETPYGTFRLDYFFNKSMPTNEGNTVSQEHIKSKIYNLVSEENQTQPLKDCHIADIINKEGIRIARRTVAKYREELKIPPAHARRRSA